MRIRQKRKAVGIPEDYTDRPVAMLRETTNKRSRRKAAGEKFVLPVKDSTIKPPRRSKSSVPKVFCRNEALPEDSRMPVLEPQNGVFSSAKIKLQLFPIDESTRLKLEKDGHNPFLELTLSARKKISSVIAHLNTKWGSSSAAVGELMLFSYNTKLENISSCRRWTSGNTEITAGEIREVLENHAVFRLRYGWFPIHNAAASVISCTSFPVEAHSESANIEKASNSISRVTSDRTENFMVFENRPTGNLVNVHETANGIVTGQMKSDVSADFVSDDMMHNVPTRSVVSWDGSLTSLSIGGLLSEASLLEKINTLPRKSESKSGLEPLLVSDISIGGLLSEASLQGKITDSKLKPKHESVLLPTTSLAELRTIGSSTKKIDNPDLVIETEVPLPPIHLVSELSVGGLLSEASLQGKLNTHDTSSSMKMFSLEPTEQNVSTQLPRDDSVTALSIGGLLSEASLQAIAHICDPKAEGSTSNLKSMIPTFDSFDAFLAAQFDSHHPAPNLQLLDSCSTILDAEETCHAFPFQNSSGLSKDSATSIGRDDSAGHVAGLKSKTSISIRNKNTSTDSLVACHSMDEKGSSLGLRGIKSSDCRDPFDRGLPLLKQVGGGDGISEFVNSEQGK